MQLFTSLTINNDSKNAQTNSTKKQNTQIFKVHLYPKQYIIETNQKAITLDKHLIIDRDNGNLYEKSGAPPQSKHEQMAFSAFLGTIYILNEPFLLFVDEAELICTIDEQDIFQIASVSFLSYMPNIMQSAKANTILKTIAELRKLLVMGFYFSYGYDLTLSKVKQHIEEKTDERFLWNLNLIKNHLKQQIDRKWLTTIIQGFINYFYLYINGKKLDFYLMSRRSSQRAGTRYNARGIDDDGNVANFVETEQIIYYNNHCCSHLQVRGSVPIFWSQRGWLIETKIMRSAELTKRAFKKHFASLFEDYSRVICLNLMAKKKKDEQMVTQGFEEQIKANSTELNENIKYEWFDFHHECKNNDFSLSNPLIRKLMDHIQNFGFFLVELKTKKVVSVQHGIFRTNCMDCLDRTNFIQTKIAMSVFDIQIKKLGVDFQNLLKMSPIEALDENSSHITNYFVQYFKNIWADNGDMLSNQYTGTGSTHTNITRTGKRDLDGILDHGKKTIGRVGESTIWDNFKQEAIDILLGNHADITASYSKQIVEKLKSRCQEFCSFSERTILVATWNVGGETVQQQYDLNRQILDYQADIIVIGLQEMVNSATGLVGGSSQYLKNWDKLIANNLRQRDKYIYIKSKELQGIGLFIYAKERFQDRITKVSYDKIKLSMWGNPFTNKGAVAIKMFIDDTLVCFINCNLEYGEKSLDTRLQNLNDIHQTLFNQTGIGKKKEEKIEQCDYRILLGNLNFRINLEKDKILIVCRKKSDGRSQGNILVYYQFNIRTLKKYDEIKINREENQYLNQYQESDINFLPTYKFDPFSERYDESRTPSWNDRILVAQNEHCEHSYQYYKSHNVTYSDHRPVSALINIKTRKEIAEKKANVISSIIQNES
ncbi:unnamed protein product (macronuclear) [Paramecium tetraurelia]|uniref:phosphoinositide 5-phosphatase n=1 Tax=Paramecium tetraurelia TaxID=5888 RepID=A0CZD8_PARTE|nr:uncharacterized protein GSPATT00011728001 [Paramecium tetraurelia]CAK76155.1 unnamed protein product [Paramecium tetraurelia]|eukprot:XP_001443552.1 hypothetical protein (macronuclear) [Paramecium tetraurelia strain d4-2]